MIGGSFISATEGENTSSGCMATRSLCKANIKPTGTGLDQTLFFTVETAQEIAQASVNTGREASRHPQRARFRRCC